MEEYAYCIQKPWVQILPGTNKKNLFVKNDILSNNLSILNDTYIGNNLTIGSIMFTKDNNVYFENTNLISNQSNLGTNENRWNI